MKNFLNADLKPLLIDLEVCNNTTGGKQEQCSVQPERLSEGDNMYCVYYIHLPEKDDMMTQGYVGITSDFKERMRTHPQNKKDYHFKNAINKYGWDNLVKQIICTGLKLEDALRIEATLRPTQNIGWNSQKGGVLGVEKEWYDIPENKEKHRLNTSKATLEGIAREIPGSRSIRAKESRVTNKESYKDSAKGSKNSRAILNEKQVKCIKCQLIPSGLKLITIARMYNVGDYVIHQIKSGKNWQHVVCDSPAHDR